MFETVSILQLLDLEPRIFDIGVVLIALLSVGYLSTLISTIKSDCPV